MNIKARLKFELVYYDSAVRCFNHYTTKTPPLLSNKLEIICLNAIKWLQALPCNTNRLIQQAFICTQLNGTIDRTLTSSHTPGQSGPGCNANEWILHIPQSTKNGALPSDGLVSYPEHTWSKGLITPQRRSWDILQSYPTGLINKSEKKKNIYIYECFTVVIYFWIVFN